MEITDHVAAHRLRAAEDLAEAIFAAVDRLNDFPEIGRQIPEFGRPDLRELICLKYRIIYRLTAERLEILIIRHSLQHLDESDLAQ